MQKYARDDLKSSFTKNIGLTKPTKLNICTHMMSQLFQYIHMKILATSPHNFSSHHFIMVCFASVTQRSWRSQFIGHTLVRMLDSQHFKADKLKFKEMYSKPLFVTEAQLQIIKSIFSDSIKNLFDSNLSVQLYVSNVDKNTATVDPKSLAGKSLFTFQIQNEILCK